jgi:hypothetical protein
MAWEYLVQDIVRGRGTSLSIQTELNKLGTIDWELVSVMKMTGASDRYFFRREVHSGSLGERVSSLFHREPGGEGEDDEGDEGGSTS